jgi:ubiquitin-protein ligase
MLQWHLDLFPLEGPLEGVRFHITLNFPHTYPKDPPSLTFPSHQIRAFRHPNLYGSWLCLDMLQGFIGSQDNLAGWSTAYSVRGILLQLQGFLFDFAPQDHGSDKTVVIAEDVAEKVREEAARLTCWCGCPGPLKDVLAPGRIVEPPAPRAVDPVRQAARRKARSTPVVREKAEEKAPIFVSGKVVGRNGDWVKLDNGRWARPAVQVGSMAHGVLARDGRSVDLRVNLDEAQRKGSLVPAVVERAEQYGLFLRVGRRVGLAHRSRIPMYPWPKVGEPLLCRVVENGDKLDLSLSPFALVPAPPAPTRAVGDVIAGLPDAVTSVALGFLDLATLLRLFHVSFGMRGLAEECLAAKHSRHVLTCFHTKASYRSCVLGVGMLLKKGLPGRKGEFSVVFEPLSLSAFNSGVRHGVWRNVFNHFLPLAVDQAHFERAAGQVRRSLVEIAFGYMPSEDTSDRLTLTEYLEEKARKKEMGVHMAAIEAAFDPLTVFRVLPKLMNDCVVALMDGAVWASSKALEGYMAYHHLFLALARKYPEIKAKAESDARRFLSRADWRVKEHCPNLGEFLCALAVTDVSWEEVAVPLLEEAFDRNVLWVLKQSPRFVDKAEKDGRVECSFRANRVSLKLLSFQAWFIRKVARPAHQTATDVLERYDRTKGVPPAALVDALQAHCTALGGMKNHADFFRLAGLRPVGQPELEALLVSNLANSARKRYHNARIFQQEAWAKEAKKEAKKWGAQDDGDYDDY